MKILYFVLFVFLGINLSVSQAENRGKESPVVSNVLAVPATVYSKDISDITTEIRGKVITVADVGKMVHKGEIIVKIDDEHERKLLTLYLAKEKIVTQKINLLSEQVDRNNILRKKGSISTDEVDSKQLNLLDTKQELQSLKIIMSHIENDIKKKNLTAEYGGIVLEKYIVAGENVAEFTPLIRVLVNKPKYVKARIPANMVQLLDTANAVFNIDPMPSLDVSLDYVSSEININSNTVEVSFKMNFEKQMMLGQKGIIELQLQSKHN